MRDDAVPCRHAAFLSDVAPTRSAGGSKWSAPAQLRSFPAVAFHPFDDTELPHFWTVRDVGVIRNIAVTGRLPDRWWNGDAEEFDSTPGGGPLEIAKRFFPVADDVTAEETAEAIGLPGEHRPGGV